MHSGQISISEKKLGLVVIGVHPDWQGKGILQMLMEKFEQEAMQRNVCKITLSVRAKNKRAIAAYQKTGWKTASLNDRELKMYKLIYAKKL